MKIQLNTLVTLVLLLPALLLKYQQQYWSSDQVQFLLYPVQSLVHGFTGLPSTYQVGEGYVFPGFMIEKSCAGLNFLVILWTALVWLSCQNERPWPSKIGSLAWSLPIVYLVCILANTFRILSALLLLRVPGSHQPNVHEALGILVYLSTLLLTVTLFNHCHNPIKHAKLA